MRANVFWSLGKEKELVTLARARASSGAYLLHDGLDVGPQRDDGANHRHGPEEEEEDGRAVAF